MGNGMNSFLSSSWYKNASAARNWINSVPQTAAATSAFSSCLYPSSMPLNLSPHLVTWLGPAHAAQLVRDDPGEVDRRIVGAPLGRRRRHAPLHQRRGLAIGSRRGGPQRDERGGGRLLAIGRHLATLPLLHKPVGGHLNTNLCKDLVFVFVHRPPRTDMICIQNAKPQSGSVTKFLAFFYFINY